MQKIAASLSRIVALLYDSYVGCIGKISYVRRLSACEWLALCLKMWWLEIMYGAHWQNGGRAGERSAMRVKECRASWRKSKCRHRVTPRIQNGEVDYYPTQMLRGHWCFPVYLSKAMVNLHTTAQHTGSVLSVYVYHEIQTEAYELSTTERAKWA